MKEKVNYAGIHNSLGSGFEYENYNDSCKNYAFHRLAVGHLTILSQLKDASNAHILDAGCGTGNYSKLLSPFVRKITAIELSDGMRSVA